MYIKYVNSLYDDRNGGSGSPQIWPPDLAAHPEGAYSAHKLLLAPLYPQISDLPPSLDECFFIWLVVEYETKKVNYPKGTDKR